MGWKLTAFAFLFALWAINVGALIIGIPILLYLAYRFWANRQSAPGAPGRPRWMIYGGVLLVLLSLVAVAEQGTYSPVVFGVSGLALLVLGLFPGLVQQLADGVAGPASEMFRGAPGRKRGPSGPEGCVELTKVPLGYLDPKKEDPKETLQRFQRLSQTLGELGFPVELRLEFSGGVGRMTFTAPGGREERLRGLLRVVRSQLPEFGAQLAERAAVDGLYSVPVEGVPEPSPDPLGALARFFVENRLAGSYSVTVRPAWVNPASRWAAARSQKRLAEGSGYQRVDDERTTTMVDHPKQVELEASVKGLERLLGRRPVKVSVLVSAGDPGTAAHAADVLAGVMSSQRMIDGLKVRRPRRSARSGWRRSSLMLPSEAAPYLWLPQVALGMKVAPTAQFHEPPASEGEIVLGEAVSFSGKTGRLVRIGRDRLSTHVFVTGRTGSGKSTTCWSILLQLSKMGVPFLVVEPVKTEYRSLLAAIPDLQVFTVGDEDAAPFRLNVFEPPPGVKAQAHLDRLVAVWNSAFVSYAPTPYVIPRVFAEAYRACGWDLRADTRGRPVTFDDVAGQVDPVVDALGYEPKVTMDIRAAIMVRLDSLRTGTKGDVFGALASTPMEAVLERPTVIELQAVENDEEKAFVASLMLSNLAACARVRGPSRTLKHFTMIEEAHRLLPKVSTEKGSPEAADSRRALVEAFGNMLAELRAYGEGLGVVEQIPTKILPDAIKNTATKVVHQVQSADDREVMAGAMAATEEQADVLQALNPGEAVVSVEGHPVPVRVEVEDVVAKLGVRPGEVGDLEVRRRMAGFYLRHPLPRQARPLEERVRSLVESERFRAGFLQAYRGWVKTGDTAGLRGFLLQEAAGLGRGDAVDLATKVLSMASAYYLPLDAEQRARFPLVFRRELARARVDERGR